MPVPGPAVHDERAARPGADDRVLVGLDGAEHVPHPGRAAAAEGGDEGGLVVERRGVPVEPALGEDLVPVVADPAPGPPVPAAARQPHRLGVGRPEERLGRRGAPVEQQPPARTVGETQPPDVHRLLVVRGHHVPEAQVETEPAQRAQPGGQPVHLEVAVHRLLPGAAGLASRGVDAVGQVGDRLLQAPRDGGEVRLVPRRPGPGRPSRRGRRRGRTRWWSGVPRISSRPSVSGHGRRLWGPAGALPQAPRCAIPWRRRGARLLSVAVSGRAVALSDTTQAPVAQ